MTDSHTRACDKHDQNAQGQHTKHESKAQNYTNHFGNALTGDSTCLLKRLTNDWCFRNSLIKVCLTSPLMLDSLNFPNN